jgi:hypothetical protein
MKIEKWQFTVVPYIDRVKWEHPITQVIYSWMCKFSNEEWKCYPSIEKLSECCWTGITSIKTYLQRLIDLRIIEKNYRYKEWLQTSSEYIILHPDGSHNTTSRGSPDVYELNPLIIIREKSEILDLLGEEDTDKYKNHLICLWNMIEMWYWIEKNKSSVLSNIERVKDKADIYWYRMIDWNYDRNTLRQKFDRRKEWHIAKKDKIDNYKNSVITFLAPSDYKKWWKQKK